MEIASLDSTMFFMPGKNRESESDIIYLDLRGVDLWWHQYILGYPKRYQGKLCTWCHIRTSKVT